MPEATAFEYSQIPMLSASPAVMDASLENLNDEQTVQMNFIDHVSYPDRVTSVRQQKSEHGWTEPLGMFH